MSAVEIRVVNETGTQIDKVELAKAPHATRTPEAIAAEIKRLTTKNSGKWVKITVLAL